MRPDSIATVPADPIPAADAGRGQQHSTPSQVSSGLSAMTPNRRQALTVAGLGVGALTLAACGSGTTGSAAATSTSSAPAGSSAGASGGGGGTSLVALSSVPLGQAVSAALDGKPVIVAQPAAGRAVAFSAICTHMGCTVAPKGAELDCPCHGSRYNALTGEVIHGPALTALPKVTVTVKGGQVVAGMVTGADSIDDLDALREGAVGKVLPGVKAPSMLGTAVRGAGAIHAWRQR